ncbi:hypothetical protein RBB78_09450 [Tunturiibacter empetritectus]|uniref:hypothetical protein n=1 Tax=Tunturiibacter empetritectus TaxID=3069691 RepID=UPI003D9B563D
MRIASVGTAYPPHRYSQAQISEALTARWQDRMEEPRLINRLFVNCGVDFRNLVFPLDVYENLSGFGPTNDAWIVAAVELGEKAIDTALARVGLTPADISAIFFASVTGIASPTIDARLINRMPFPTSIKRTPIFGLGCVAGAAGISRASDYVRAFPNQYALLLSVELCSSPGRTTTSPSPTSSPAASSATAPPPSSSQALRPPSPSAPAPPASPAQRSSIPARPSIDTPNTSWAGTSATWASKSSSPPTSPRSSTNIFEATLSLFSPTTV